METIPLADARFVGWVLFTIGVAVIAGHTLLSGLAAERAGLSGRGRAWVPVAVGIFLATWFSFAVVAADAAHFASAAAPVPRPAALAIGFAPMLLAVALLFGSRTLSAVYAAMPSDWLIRIQLYRVLGVMFLFPFLYYGSVPAAFAWPAAIGDAITGGLTPLVAKYVARRDRRAFAWAIAWNLFGILDLIVAPVAGVLSRSNLLAMYPVTLVALFIGPPLGILTHIYSLRNLVLARRTEAESEPDLSLGRAESLHTT
jgi:hypothetical protein